MKFLSSFALIAQVASIAEYAVADESRDMTDSLSSLEVRNARIGSARIEMNNKRRGKR